ncbi:Dicer-like protein 1 [Irineochytrium annulatum]|nr:Dicer-like protein 1 [Irineochytrium annulatum]
MGDGAMHNLIAQIERFPLIQVGLNHIDASIPVQKVQHFGLRERMEWRVTSDADLDIKSPRAYQVRIEICKGSGKTLVACLLIKYRLALEKMRREKEEGTRKVIIFMVPTVALVFQQQAYIQYQIDGVCKPLCGDLTPSQTDKPLGAHWREMLQHDVIVSTPYLVLNALNHAVLKMEEISMMIFDECHNCVGENPYSLIMSLHYQTVDAAMRPKILGLTASPINSGKEAKDAIGHLERILDARAVTVFHVSSGGAKAEAEILDYSANPVSCYDLPLYRLVVSMDKRSASKFGESMSLPLGNKQDEVLSKKKILLEKCKALYRAVSLANDRNTPKIEALTALLRQYETDPTFSAIIFVQRRQTAVYLSEILRNIPALAKFVRVGHVVGQGSGGDASSVGVKNFQRFQALAEFREGRLNLIVATKVAEEGIHIPSCKLVVRFDLEKDSMNLVNYIQSRGRARSEQARFVLMCEYGNDEHFNLIYDLRDKEVEVDLFSALTYLSEYCGRLPHRDDYVSAFEMKVTSTPSGFVATLSVPSPGHQSVRMLTGFPAPTKKKSRQVVALLAVKKLHEVGHLDDNLIPCCSFAEDDDGGDNECDELKRELMEMKGKRRKRWHAIKVPDAFLIPWASPEVDSDVPITAHLTYILIEDMNAAGGFRTHPFGLLTREPLPEVMTLTIFPTTASLKCSICRAGSVEINPVAVEMLRKYTSVTLTPYVKKGVPATEETSMVVAPVREGEASEDIVVDWNKVKEVLEFNPHAPENRSLLYSEAIGSRTYNVSEFYKDLRPDQPVPMGFNPPKTTLDYYDKLKAKSIRLTEPVIKGEIVNRRVNMLSGMNLYTAFEDKVKIYEPVFLVPQKSVVHPLKSKSALNAASYMPSFMYYISDQGSSEIMYRADELRKKFELSVELESMMSAITGPGAGTMFSYERLETLGDAFLKARRARLRSFTSHLIRLGAKFGLGGYLLVQHLSRTTWRPMLVKKQAPETLPNHPLPIQLGRHLLGDKQVADVFEAILGACLDSRGLKAAAAALRAMYDDGFLVNWEDYSEHYNGGWENEEAQLTERRAIIAPVEALTGYKFKNVYLLLEAFKHPSSEDLSSPLQDAIASYCQSLMHAKTAYDREVEEIAALQGDDEKSKKKPILYWERVEPPKVISDILEALLGAVFVDSKFDIEAVWSVMQVSFDVL